MKRVLVGIFAHPDDEAFGPSGTLLTLKDEGYDIHLLLLTDGDAGTNPGVSDLTAVRQEEWRRSCAVLGVTSATRFGLGDGKLHEETDDSIDSLLASELKNIAKLYSEPIEISLVTFEPEGLTGHTDHIAASKAATRLYTRLKNGDFEANSGQIWYYCLSKEHAPLEQTPYYHPQARDDDYITHRMDVADVLERKYQMIDCHATQVADAVNLKTLGDDLLSLECFHVES